MSNLSVSPSQTDVERRTLDRLTSLEALGHSVGVAPQGVFVPVADLREMLSEIERLRGALHESRKDRERLDWLDEPYREANIDIGDGGDYEKRARLSLRGLEGKPYFDYTLRAAIDAARAGNGETT